MKTLNFLFSTYISFLLKGVFLWCFLFNITSCKSPQSENQEKETNITSLKFWVGTYTSNKDQGIHLIGLDTNTKDFDSLWLQNEIENPSFVISNTDQNLLFSVQEAGGNIGGSVASFKIDKDSLKLKPINTVSTLGSGPCYIALSPDEHYILAGNYKSGNLAVIPVHENGTLSEAIQEFSHQGSSINPNRQEKPHVHSIVFHPDGNRFFVGDLGTDRVYIYEKTNNENSPYKAASPPYFEVKAGSGPRHLAINKAGDKIYLIHELTGEVGLYDFQKRENQPVIRHLETYSLTGKDFNGEVSGAEIKISQDGKFLYASNRGDANQINVFEIDPDSGKLNKIQSISSGGKTPRNFTLSKDGNFLLVGNQNSDEIALMSRNNETGIIKDSKVRFPIHKPVYFYEFNP